MLGLSDEEIQERFPEIVRFSELGDFIEQPVRTYSSGMVMRLGFAIASCVDPDILIIDEVLSVGDAYFSQKCIRRIREFREKGVTILFVSHDPTAVLTLCDHAVLLENGTVQRCGAFRCGRHEDSGEPGRLRWSNGDPKVRQFPRPDRGDRDAEPERQTH
jgi:lipopolysaccharide transport system ATP-binding protein